MWRLVVLLLIPLCYSAVMDNAYDEVLAQEEQIKIPECEENEVWMDCPSCEQKCGESPTHCPRVCQSARCHCPAHKGFKRSLNGSCVAIC